MPTRPRGLLAAGLETVKRLEPKRIKRLLVVLQRQARAHHQPGEPGGALATTKSAPATIVDPDDRAIGDQLLAELKAKNWVDLSSADIIVRGGVVHLWFSDEQPREERLTFRVAAENIPGVRRVEEHIVAQPGQLAESRGAPR